IADCMKTIVNFVWNVLVRIATLPYYRLYHFNTIGPMEKIAVLSSEPCPDTSRLVRTITAWRTRKIAELHFVTISCAVLAAAVIGSFSWTFVADAYWLTYGFWHSSLILSVLGMLLSASEATVLHLLGPLSVSDKNSTKVDAIQTYSPLLLSPRNNSGRTFVPRKKMIFTWQAPLMFMSYSVCAFLLGLTILVCTPLIRDGANWTTGHNIAIMYLITFGLAGTLFVFASFWVFHYVDLDID
ncbi:uncharacterized protein EI97DRAFT_364895, partial [Westerdykella ornata]